MSVRVALGLATATQLASFVILFGAQIVLARLLQPAEFGVYVAAAAIAAIVAAFQAFGLGNFVVREPTIDQRLLRTVFTINAALALCIGAILLLLSMLPIDPIQSAGIDHLLPLLALVPLIGAFELVPAALLQREMLFGRLAFVTLSKALVNAAVSIYLAYKGLSYMAIGWGTVAGAVAAAAVANVALPARFAAGFGFGEWRKVLGFGGNMLAIAGVSTLATRMADIILGATLGLHVLGLYSRAASVNSMLWDNVHLILARVMFSDLAQNQRAGGSLRERYLTIMRFVTAMLWPAFAGLAILAGPVIDLLYGSRWIEAAMPLSLLALASMLLVALSMTWEVYVINNQTGRQARLESLRAGVSLAIFAAACKLGLTAATAARVADACIAIRIYHGDLRRLTSTMYADMVPIYRDGLLATAAAIAPALAVMLLHGWPERLDPALFVAAIGAGGCCWLAALRWRRHPIYREVLALLRWFVGKRTNPQELTPTLPQNEQNQP